MANPITTCIGCTQADDHPKHSVLVGDGSSVNWHFDCHAVATGCDSCGEAKKAANGATGDEFREAILEQHADLAAELAEQAEQADKPADPAEKES